MRVGLDGQGRTSVSRPCSAEVSSSRTLPSAGCEACGIMSSAAAPKASRQAATSAARRLRSSSMYSRSLTEWPG